jgi:hypothetical protein
MAIHFAAGRVMTGDGKDRHASQMERIAMLLNRAAGRFVLLVCLGALGVIGCDRGDTAPVNPPPAPPPKTPTPPPPTPTTPPKALSGMMF